MGKKFNLSNNKTYTNRTAIKNNVNTIMPTNNYQSKVDYTNLNVTNEEKVQLINYEQIVVKKQEAVSLSLMELSTALYNAQQILSQKQDGDGSFTKWFEQLNLSKPFVYRCLSKYKLYLISNMETVMDLTVKETAMITKALNNNDIKEAEVIDIIQSDNIIKYLDEKIYGPEEQTEVDLDSFKSKTKEEQKQEYKQTKKDIKIMTDEISKKKEQLKKMKEEIENLIEQVKMIKEIAKNMKIEIDNNR